jgi:hypothetical protein
VRFQIIHILDVYTGFHAFSVSIDDDSSVSVPCDLGGLLLIVLSRLNGRSFLRMIDDGGVDMMSTLVPVGSTGRELYSFRRQSFASNCCLIKNASSQTRITARSAP